MFDFIANIFGYLLFFLYNIINNYGIAIILFTIIIKILLIPLSIKQQRNMKKTAEMQEKIKIIQFKYKNDQEKAQKEMMNLYKTENASPFSGCLSVIIQFLLLISIFFLVKGPLVYMQKIPQDTIDKYTNQLIEENRVTSKSAYPQIDIIREYEWLKEKNPEDTEIEKVNLNMNFFGLDLRKVPQQNMGDFTVYIIPILYIISSFISIKLTTAMQQGNKNEKKLLEEKAESPTEKQETDSLSAINQSSKMMTWMMPIMSITVAFVAPLGLALYWLTNNILMIIERILLNKFIKD